ncbi:hypothetical protein HOE425_331308 [Hoeflea sp. EC-HK425]|nr:hypothetical protein HOE425_331308 [Hoeflea sp. EC-HK425]
MENKLVGVLALGHCDCVGAAPLEFGPRTDELLKRGPEAVALTIERQLWAESTNERLAIIDDNTAIGTEYIGCLQQL